MFKIDHHYPHLEEGSPVLILYGQPGSPGFSSVHANLKQLAESGQIDYVLRPYIRSKSTQKTRLSGYGVELQIKSSEYKAQDDRKVQAEGDGGEEGSEDHDKKEEAVEGFLFDTLNERHPDKKDKLDEFKQHLKDQKNDMAPLKVWQLQDLSMQAAEKILAAPASQQLKTVTDLSQNFPSYARSLSKTKVSKELKKEVKKNAESFLMNMNVQTNDAALFINGMYFDMDYVDIFTILDTLKSEGKVLDGLGDLGLTDEQARKMMSQDFSTNKQTYGIDVRDSAVNWVNNIEEDKLYKSWPESVTELLRPTFPGMMRSVRKNFFNVVIMADPSKKDVRPLLKLLESFYVHRAPTRIGIVFTVNEDPNVSGMTDAGVALLCAYNYIAQEKEAYDALAFITDVYSKIEDSDDLEVSLIHKMFIDSYGGGESLKISDVFDEDSEYDVGRQLAKDFADKSGFSDLPQVLMNGVPLDGKSLNGEDFEEALMMSIMKVTNELQRAVYRNMLKDQDDVLDYLMKQPNIMPRLNDRVLKGGGEVAAKYIDLSGAPAEADALLSAEKFAPLSKAGMAATVSGKRKKI